MITVHSADPFDIQLCHRLFIGYDGQRLQERLRQHIFPGSACHLDQIFIHIPPGAHLERILKLCNGDASAFLLPFVLHFSDNLSGSLFVFLYHLSQLAYLHGLSHSKKHRFHGSLLPSAFHPPSPPYLCCNGLHSKCTGPAYSLSMLPSSSPPLPPREVRP